MGLLTGLDIAVVAAYFSAIVLIGLYFGRFTRTTADFFVAGQRFTWWPVALSCVATLVGSYSFINYSDLGYDHGLSSAVYYTNDWFILPLFLLGWLPIFYFRRLASVPEYFEQRFDRRTRQAVLVVAVLFLIGYIGMNLQTIGVVAERLTGVPVLFAALIVAVVSLVYMHHGGQMSVLGTDVFQGFLLLGVGFAVLFVGAGSVGGWLPLWNGLEGKYQAPFPGFNHPTSFHFVGSFWGDGFSNTIAFFFINQGIILRFLSTRSVTDARRAMIVTVLVLMPLAAIAVSGGGWVGRAMVGLGMEDAPTKEKGIFVTVAQMVTAPGFFGFVVAGLLAALMSTLDTYINAVAALAVNDILKPRFKGRSDRFYLNAARWVAVGATLVGLALVPIFELSDTIYKAHAAFFACVNPPLVVVILMGCLWRRFTPAAAFWALLLGTGITLLSLVFPDVVAPLAHGESPEDRYLYMRALFGGVVTLALGLGISAFTRPRPTAEIAGLTLATVRTSVVAYYGGEPRPADGRPTPALPVTTGDTPEGMVRLTPALMERLKAQEGDRVHVSDSRWWLGGLASTHLRLGPPHDSDGASMHAADLDHAGIRPDRRVVVERVH